MAANLPEFDPHIIERHVEGLLRKSSAFVVGSVVLGVFLGAAFGATPLTSLGSSWPIPRAFGFATLLVGGIVGGIVGYVIGDTRSFMYKLQAQIALAQVKAAQDSEAVLTLLSAAAKAAAPSPRTETPPRQPQAAPQPARVQPPTATPPPAPAPTPAPAPAQPLPAPEPAVPHLTAVGESTPAPPLSPPVSG